MFRLVGWLIWFLSAVVSHESCILLSLWGSYKVSHAKESVCLFRMEKKLYYPLSNPSSVNLLIHLRLLWPNLAHVGQNETKRMFHLENTKKIIRRWVLIQTKQFSFTFETLKIIADNISACIVSMYNRKVGILCWNIFYDFYRCMCVTQYPFDWLNWIDYKHTKK